MLFIHLTKDIFKSPRAFFQRTFKINITNMSATLLATITVYQGEQGRFYYHNGIWYDCHFPVAYALDHNPTEYTAECGPERCALCSTYGYVRNVFVGYCWDCAAAYQVPRGCAAVKMDEEVFCFPSFSQENVELRIPYMVGVSLEEIGNEEEQKEEQEQEQQQEQEQEQEQGEDDDNESYYEEEEYSNDDYEEEEEYWDEERQLDEELARCPSDMRAAFDPRLQEAFKNFRFDL
jgi:hypothetical protein